MPIVPNGLSIPTDMRIDLTQNAKPEDQILRYGFLREIQVDVFEKLRTKEKRYLITSLSGLKAIRDTFAEDARVTLISNITENAKLDQGWSFKTNIFEIPDFDITVIGVERVVLQRAGLLGQNDEMTSVIMTQGSVLRYKTEITNGSWANIEGFRKTENYDGYDIMTDRKDMDLSIQHWLTHARFHEVIHRADNRSVYLIKHKIIYLYNIKNL